MNRCNLRIDLLSHERLLRVQEKLEHAASGTIMKPGDVIAEAFALVGSTCASDVIAALKGAVDRELERSSKELRRQLTE